MNLQGKSILIKPDQTTKTPGGILLSSMAKKTPTGRVLDTGPGCETVKPGDRIHYTPQKANLITIEGEEHHFIDEDDVAYIY